MLDTATLSRITIAIVFSGGLLAASATALANAEQTCDGLLPPDAESIGEVFLCPGAGGNASEPFACRDYVADGRIYRILLRGGNVPRLAFELARRGAAAQRLDVGGRSCSQQRPPNLPEAACFRGTGVCADERGRPLPCSVFEFTADPEHSAPRHYLVYYEPDGSGVRRIDAMAGTRRNNAIEAELAFALASSMQNGNPERAKAYLEHAAALDPGDPRFLEARMNAAASGHESAQHEAAICASR